MIAALIVLALIVGAVLALWAGALEWLAVARRGVALRWIWVAAMVLTVAIPMLRLALAPREGAALNTASAAMPMLASRADVDPAAASVSRNAARVSAINETGGATGAWRLPSLQLPSPPARTVRTAWLVVSGALTLLVLGSTLRLRHDARRWSPATIGDTPVLVSDGLGPALVGLFAPQIVVPPWVLALDEATSRTILTHEQEHKRAGDVWLLALAGALVIAMPWHPLLWWMRMRLVRAVEFDCDARVVARGITRATYADHLLRAWQQASGARRHALAPAFAERRSALGQRVTHMLRQTPRRPIMKRVLAGAVVVACVVVALLLPTPQVAQRVEAVEPVSRVPLVVIDGTPRPDLNSLAAVQKDFATRAGPARFAKVQQVDSVRAMKLYGQAALRGATLAWTKGYIDGGGATMPESASVKAFGVEEAISNTTSPEEIASLTVPQLLTGATILPGEVVEVRRLVTETQRQMSNLRGPARIALQRSVALLQARNAAISAIISDPAQRGIVDRNARAAMEGLRVPSIDEVAENDVMYNFIGTASVTPMEIDRAVDVVARSLRAEEALYARAPDDTTALRRLREQRIADVRGALQSDASRAAFDKRATTIRRGLLTGQAVMVIPERR